jgi:hypothetical protein
MSPDRKPTPAGAPARQQQPVSTVPSGSDPKRSAKNTDAAKAEPVPHQRPPVRSDDN